MKMTNRRGTGVATATAALMLALTACGGPGNGGPADDGPVEIRFAWWGSAERAELTQQAIDKFEEKHPNIKVSPEYTEFGAYFDRLATNVAAKDAPDVITLGGAYPREYGDRGALLDLTEVSEHLDLSKFPDSVLASGEFSGVQYAVPTGVNTFAMVANPRIFEEAGVEMPDDDAWSWEDFIEISENISEKTGGDAFGTADPTTGADVVDLFSRQKGESLYTDDGGLNISTDTMESWWEMTSNLSESGAAPSAQLTTELAGQDSPEQNLMGRGQTAMMFAWSNVYTAQQEATGEELELLRVPGDTTGEQPGMWLQASQLYSISATSEHPEEAAMLVDFLVNDPEAAQIIKTDRGIPANPEVLEAIRPDLTEAQQREAEFIARITEVAGSPLVIGPVGSTATPLILERLNAEVLFGRITPAEAAQQFVDEVTTEISQ